MANENSVFVQTLKNQREALNARYALRTKTGARINGEAFLEHLERYVAPLVEATHEHLPERTAVVLNSLYDASLDLFAATLLGPNSKLAEMERVWAELLPACTKPLARDPAGITGCLCNGLYYVAQQHGARAEVWLTQMRDVLPHCRSLQELRDVGQIAAWQAGMPQFRQSALDVASRLPTQIAARGLGLAAVPTADQLSILIGRLKTNPWLTVDAAEQQDETAAPQLRHVSNAGSFIGFGGLFIRPPIVASLDGRLIITDGRLHWRLVTDAYGTWFQPVPETRLRATTAQGDVALDHTGQLRWGKSTLQVPHLSNPTSMSCDGTTLAVTKATSHHVFLFAHTSQRW